MKFICNQQKLIKALNTVSKAVGTKTTLEILSGILLEVTELGKLVITTSDMDLRIQKILDISDNEYIEGNIVVNAKLFLDIVRKLPNENITVEDNNNFVTEIKSQNSEFTIINQDGEEFPKIRYDNEESYKVTFDKESLKKMISMTTFAASIDESRGVLVGNLIEIRKNITNMVALDGFRLSKVTDYGDNEIETDIIVSARILNEVNKIISEEETKDEISLNLTKKSANLRLGDTSIFIRLLEGNYLNYKNIIPKTSRTQIIINKDDFIDSIERASILAKGKNNLIKFSIENNLITLTSRSEEGNVKEEIIAEKTGEDIEIGFNSKYLIDALKVINDEYIKLHLNSNIESAVIRPIESDEYEFLILPVRIS